MVQCLIRDTSLTQTGSDHTRRLLVGLPWTEAVHVAGGSSVQSIVQTIAQSTVQSSVQTGAVVVFLACTVPQLDAFLACGWARGPFTPGRPARIDDCNEKRITHLIRISSYICVTAFTKNWRNLLSVWNQKSCLATTWQIHLIRPVSQPAIFVFVMT